MTSGRRGSWLENGFKIGSDVIGGTVNCPTSPEKCLIRDIIVDALAQHSRVVLLPQDDWMHALKEDAQMSYMVAVNLSERLEKYAAESSTLSLRNKINGRLQCRHCGAAFDICVDATDPATLRCRECRTRH